jgi:CheY-like chemotaxis protein
MGGHIRVSSVLGVGSTFKIELPVVIANAENIIIKDDYRTVKSLAPNQAALRLLVVDDNADNRLLLTTILKENGFQVREAENGQVAIEQFQEWKPDLIWMDMRMPVMDGYEATAKIRQLAGGHKVKILALTASAFAEQHLSIIEAGCDAVLHKPFHVAEIFAALTKYLGVEFIYDDTSALTVAPTLKITPEMMKGLPLELRQQFHNAALKLDIEELDLLIAQIHTLSPEIAGGLDVLAKNYQFEQIIQLVDAETF